MTQRKIGKSWWVDITHQGVRYRKKCPDNSKEGAKAYESHLRRKLAQGESIKRIEQLESQAQLFKHFVGKWFTTYVEVHNKPSEVIRKKYIINSTLLPYFGNFSLNEISSFHVENYISKLAKDGFANKTINNHLNVLRKCLSCAVEWLMLEKAPKINLLKEPPVDGYFLTEKECGELLSELDGVYYDIVLTALKTGLRIGELLGLRWQDIQWEKKTLTVNHTWCKVSKQLVSPKGNKERVIPLTPDVYGIFNRRDRSSEYVFGGIQRKQKGTHTINRIIKEACERAGVRVITCHKLRHTFASHLAIRGVPIGVIQKLLGHTTIQVTMRYAHLSETSLRDSIDLLQSTYKTKGKDGISNSQKIEA